MSSEVASEAAASEPAPKILTASDFKATKDKPRRIERVEIPDLGGAVFVRELTALERDRVEDAMVDEKGKPIADNVRAKLVCMCAVDATGRPIFQFTPEDVTAVGELPQGVIEPVYEAANRVNNWRSRARNAQKKDSDAGQLVASP